LIGGFRFEINNRVFSTLSDIVSQQLLPHFSLRIGGPTRHRQFINNANELVFCTGPNSKRAQELTVLPGSIQTVFDLSRCGMYLGPKGVWMIFLVLYQDETLYEDLRLEVTREELENAQKAQ
jgi:hypothetical protein